MGSATPTSPMEMAALLAGLCIMLCGAWKIWKERGRPGRLVAWGALVDLGPAFMGFGLELSGDAGSLLIILYHGVARLAAWWGLSRLVDDPLHCSTGDIRGAIRRDPVSAVFTALALVCTLGVSPVLTPEGLHLVLHGMATHPSPAGPPIIILMTGAYTLLVWLSAEIILELCFTSREESPERPLPVRDASRRKLYMFAGMLLIMGVFRIFFRDMAVRLAGGLPDEVIHLEGPWSLSALVLYVGAFLVLLPRVVRPDRPDRQARYAVGLLLLSFILALLSPLPPLAYLFALIVTGVGTLVACYSVSYIEDDGRKTWYWFLLLLTFGAMLSIVTTENIGSLASSWEVMSWASFALIAWERTPKARAAAVKYAVICGGAAYLMIGGLFMIGGEEAGYAEIIAGLSTIDNNALRFALVFALLGFMAKAGIAPLHGWLPDAHPAAPSSISAPLSGVLTKMGVFGIILAYYLLVGQAELFSLGRFFGLSAPGLLAVLAGLATMAVGEISALRQTDLKRMLAYSTMGQLGEIVTVVGIGTWLSTTAALAHVLNHAIMKDLLFLCAGALILRTGSRELPDLAGLGRRMPWTVGCMSIGIISIMGLPPFNGFVSKYLMIVACMDAGQPLLAVALLAASLVEA